MKTIELYTDIDSYAFDKLNYELKEANGVDVLLKINSGGGVTFDGFAMASLIREYEGKVTTLGIGIVASAATVILMAGDEITLDKDCAFMIHNAWTFAAGDSAELKKQSEVVEMVSGQIEDYYVAQLELNGSSLEREQLKAMMDAETWLTAEEALDLGFINSVRNLQKKEKPTARAVMASINKFNYKKSLEMNKEENKTFFQSFMNFFKANKNEITAMMEEEEKKAMEEKEAEAMEDDKPKMTYEELEAIAAEMGYNLVAMEEEKEEPKAEKEVEVDVVAKLEKQIEEQAKALAAIQERTISTAASDTPKANNKKDFKISAETMELFNAAASKISKFK